MAFGADLLDEAKLANTLVDRATEKLVPALQQAVQDAVRDAVSDLTVDITIHVRPKGTGGTGGVPVS